MKLDVTPQAREYIKGKGGSITAWIHYRMGGG